MNLCKLGNHVIMTDVMINQIHPPVFEFTNELTDRAKEEIVIKYNLVRMFIAYLVVAAICRLYLMPLRLCFS